MGSKNTYIISASLISIIIGVLVSILTIPSASSIGLVIIGLLLLPVFIYKSFSHRGALALFLLFCTFGLMNTDIKLFDLLFVLVAGLFFIWKKQKLQTLKELLFINFALLIFIVVSLLSLLFSKNTELGISYFFHTFFMVTIFYFLAVTIQTKKEFNSILLGYVCTVLLSVIAVILQKIGVVGDIGTWFQGVRAQGFFMDPNDFSPFLILAIVLLVDKAFSHFFLSVKYLGFISLALLVILVLLAAMSRAAILDFGIVMLLYFFFSIFYRKKYGHITVLVSLMVVACVVAWLVAGDAIEHYLSMRFLGSSDVLQSYDVDRFYYQRQGILLGSTHLFGIGPGQFEYYFGYATHNLFVRIIAENGWIALLSFAAMNLYILSLLFYFRKSEVWNFPVYLFLSVYIGMIVNSFFLDTLHWRYLWFFLGLCTIIITQAAKNKKGKR
ncbi:O-antigen ligase family protein [Neobacillus sp. PS2-9]|uniref:O-antigen ligase family protein n=1 Tax=Neobacillus sp. PS2-9 TaxID=3070676 RepID=UPI0027DEBF0C|nr:O-antigen ligase family protein [Neobacillus sp. PS2-9]WML58586.1 O-antigen ligase family protein [Neobacillus sp. PS2-9]